MLFGHLTKLLLSIDTPNEKSMGVSKDRGDNGRRIDGPRFEIG